MSRNYQLRRGALVTLAVMAGWVLLAGETKRPAAVDPSQAALRTPVRAGQLISWEPLAAEGETCLLEPASAGSNLIAALQAQEAASGKAARSSDGGGTRDFSQRKPVRKIHDPFSSFSSVAVDPTNNEVIVNDENLFSILAYDRLTNTPPQARLSEPKRMIGGLKTHIEFQCGLYIDPKNGDIYSVNNDTVGKLVVFSRKARGDVPPDRWISTPDGTFGIAVDEVHQELILTVQHDSAVVTFNKMAQGEESPIRLLQGDRTLLADPHGMTLDTNHDLIFVANFGSVHSVKSPPGPGPANRRQGAGKTNWPAGYNAAIEEAVPGSGRMLPPSITVYPRTASGDTAPLRVIAGPKARLNWPTGLAYDPRTDELFVANDMGDEVLVFSGAANGDVAPTRVIKGPKSKIKNPTGVFVDVKNDELWISNFGNHTATVYKPNASGDAPPLRMIRSAPENQPSLMIGNARIAYDTKREEILVPN